jgi:CRP-like cAMP-binding protein
MNLATLDNLPSELRNGIWFQDLNADQFLYQQGDQTTSVYVVEHGRIRVLRFMGEGKAVTFQVAGPGESLAEIALFSDTFPCAAIAEMPSRLIVYPKELLLSVLRSYPDLAEHFMSLLVKKIQGLKVSLELRNIRAAHDRVLRYLQDLATPEANHMITFDRPLKEIAPDLGLTPETLSRALSRLEQDGFIAREQRQITLLHFPAA